jgi:hypothetical protein
VSRAVVVRYRVKAEALEENVALVQAVYAELAAAQPEGIRYSTCRVDERTFVHMAVVDGPTNPLEGLPAFQTFTAGIADRCEDGPQALGGEVVGTYPAC